MKILVIDDDILSLKSIISNIKKVNPDSQILPYSNSTAVIPELDTVANHPDVVFLDVELFGITGLELARIIKERSPKTNIIFTTRYSQYALKAMDLRASGYLLKPVSIDGIRRELENLRIPLISSRKTQVKIKTFGNFEVLADDKPLVFSRRKAKEILAYLVDRKGSGVTIGELAAILWENREFDRSLSNQLQTVIVALMKELTRLDVADIIIKSRNHLAIDVSKVDCDYFLYLQGDLYAVHAYMGEYMTNYSWAEVTNSFLYFKYLERRKDENHTTL